MNDDINPVWLHLMSQYKALCDAGQSNTEQASDLFNEAYGYAPDSFKQMMRDKAIELGLMPEQPDAYSDDGEPLYFMEKQCARTSNPTRLPRPSASGELDGMMG